MMAVTAAGRSLSGIVVLALLFALAQAALPARAQPVLLPVDRQAALAAQAAQGAGAADREAGRPGGAAVTVDPSGGLSPIQPANIGSAGDQLLYQPPGLLGGTTLLDADNPRLRPPAPPGEFERYVESLVGRPLPRFGADLLVPSNRDFAVPATATVPPDYVLNVGDVVSISFTGSVDGTTERRIDSDGKIFLPKIGQVTLAGVRYGDLEDTIRRAAARQYRGYTVTVGVRQLRGIRVYVTGFANNPGAYTVNSLSTLVNAVFAAGGPSSGGSFRSVMLYRNGKLVSDFDLYNLVRRGDRTGDAVLQNEDVLFIPPVGRQLALVGSVNTEAIFEAKEGESLETLLGFAGGPSTLADARRIILYRLSDRRELVGREIAAAATAAVSVERGDIVQLLSDGTLQQPLERQSVVVRVEGEVNVPGNYFVAPGTPLSEVIARAGGFTRNAFIFGTQFQRLSVRRQQRESFDDAIQQFEITLAAAPVTGSQLVSAGERAQQAAAARAALDRLRAVEPDGRIVLNLAPTATSLPGSFVMENNDRIFVPAVPTTVGVFGAVYRPASFAIEGGQPLRVRDYLERAGGPLRAGDKGGIFVVRANGEVLPENRGALKAVALPGDVIFVPVKAQSGTLWARIREISTIIFQLGLSAAAVAAIQ